jgi:hypothetical protein
VAQFGRHPEPSPEHWFCSIELPGNENPEREIALVDNPGNGGIIITAYQINFAVYQ